MSARTREHYQKPPGNFWRLFYFRCPRSFPENQQAPINGLYASRLLRKSIRRPRRESAEADRLFSSFWFELYYSGSRPI
jgi:hypothetical protein